MNDTPSAHDAVTRALGILARHEPDDSRSARIRARMRSVLAAAPPAQVHDVARRHRSRSPMIQVLIGTVSAVYLMAVITAALRLALAS